MTATPAQPGPPSDQTIGAGALHSFSFYASDGTLATVTLQGPGDATLHFSGSDTITVPSGPNFMQVISEQLTSITTTGTSLQSVLSISTQFRSETLAIPTISADAPLGAIAAPTSHLTGDLSLPSGARQVSLLAAGTGTISVGGGPPILLLLGSTSDETISSSVPIAQLKVVHDASITLTAPSATSINVGGSLHDSNLTFTAAYASNVLDLGSLNVTMSISDVVLAGAGNIGTIAALYMTNDNVSAGVGPLASGQTFPALSDFVSTATIASIRPRVPILVPSFVNSFVAAYRINAMSLGTIQTANGGSPFSVTAHSVGRLAGTIRTTGQSFVLTNLNSAAAVTAALAAHKLVLQDFTIQIV